MLHAWVFQNQQLYLGHLYSGGSPREESCIQAGWVEACKQQVSPTMQFFNMSFAPPFPQLSNIY